MSLWKVPDLETRELMTRFYDELKSAPPARALRQAQRALLSKLRESGGGVHLVGAFVAAGP